MDLKTIMIVSSDNKDRYEISDNIFNESKFSEKDIGIDFLLKNNWRYQISKLDNNIIKTSFEVGINKQYYKNHCRDCGLIYNTPFESKICPKCKLTNIENQKTFARYTKTKIQGAQFNQELYDAAAKDIQEHTEPQSQIDWEHLANEID
jgi:predicted Zn-ribbon and HTH transcriptional regulator